jgi:hypothetical protein
MKSNNDQKERLARLNALIDGEPKNENGDPSDSKWSAVVAEIKELEAHLAKKPSKPRQASAGIDRQKRGGHDRGR